MTRLWLILPSAVLGAVAGMVGLTIREVQKR